MLRNTATVLRGTVVAQALGFLALPLLSRLFAPEAFGHLQLYQSAMTLLLVVAAMRYEIAVLRADDGAELAATLQLCAFINLVVGALAMLGCVTVWALSRQSITPMLQVMWFMPFGVVIGGWLQTLGYVPLRARNFGAGANAKTIQAGAYLGAAVGIGSVMPVSAGLLVADVVGRVASVGTLLAHRSMFDPACFARPARRELMRVARKFRDLPMVSVPGGLINAAGGVMTSILMYGLFDAAVSGQYGLVERSLMLPAGMVAVAVSQVFTADLSANLRQGGAASQALFRNVMRRMFLLGVGPTCLVAIFAPQLFSLAFGETWSVAAGFARVMAPLLLVSLVMGSVNMTLLVMGQQRIQLAWEIGRLVIVSLTWLAIAHFAVSPQAAVMLHVAASIITSLAFLWLADHVLRLHAARDATDAGVCCPRG